MSVQIEEDAQAQNASAQRVQRLKKPQPPDNKKIDAAISKLQKEIDQHGNRIKDIKSIVGERLGSGAKQSNQSVQIIQKLKDLQGEQSALKKQRESVNNNLQAANETIEAMLKAQAAKSKSGTVKLEDIENKIKELQTKLQLQNSSQDESRIIDQIQMLQRNLKSFESMGQKVGTSEAEQVRNKIINSIEKIDKRNKEVEQDIQRYREELRVMKSKVDSEEQDVPELKEEKQNRYQQILQAREQIQQIRTENQAKWDQYKADMKEFQEKQKEQRKNQDEQRRQHKERKDAAQKDREEEERGDPYDEEIITCSQLAEYLASHMPKESKCTEGEVVQQVEIYEGMTIKQKDKQTDLDDMFDTLAVKPKGSKKSKKNRQSATISDAGSKQLNHTMDIVFAFQLVKVSTPLAVRDVAATLDQVNQRKAYYEDLQKQALQAKAQGIKWVHPKQPGDTEEEEAVEEEKETGPSDTEEETEEQVQGEEEQDQEEAKDNSEEADQTGVETAQESQPAGVADTPDMTELSAASCDESGNQLLEDNTPAQDEGQDEQNQESAREVTSTTNPLYEDEQAKEKQNVDTQKADQDESEQQEGETAEVGAPVDEPAPEPQEIGQVEPSEEVRNNEDPVAKVPEEPVIAGITPTEITA